MSDSKGRDDVAPIPPRDYGTYAQVYRARFDAQGESFAAVERELELCVDRLREATFPIAVMVADKVIERMNPEEAQNASFEAKGRLTVLLDIAYQQELAGLWSANENRQRAVFA